MPNAIDFVEEATIDFQEESAPIDFAEEAEASAGPATVPSLTLMPARSPEELAARNFYDAWKATGQMPMVAHSSFWDNFNREFESNLLRAKKTTVGETQAAIDYLTGGPEDEAEPVSTPGKAAKVITGAQNAVVNAVNSFRSPIGIATLGLGTLPKAAQSLLAGAFATHMATTLPEQAKGAVEAIKAGDTEAAARHIAGTALTGTFVGLAGKHAVTAGKAALTEIKVEAAKVVGPATEAAVKGTTEAPKAAVVTDPTPAPAPRETALEAIPAEIEAPKPAVQPETPPVGLGAATPAEFELKPQNPTSIKNAVVDQERTARGLPPAMEPASKEFGVSWEQAMAKMDADYAYPDRLIAELRNTPRAATDTEVATLLHRQVELRNLQDKAMRELAQAKDDGRVEDVADLNVRVDILSNQLLDLFNIDKAVGTENARGLNARKMLANEDFTLAKMELEKRAAKGGEQLTDAERADVTRANKEITETQQAYDAYVERTTLAQKLARQFVEQGIKERDAIIDAVHAELQKVKPDITRRETMDAISGYGQYRQLSKDQISRELRDLKGQMQQVAKLEDMEAKRPPLKTGTERRIPSTEERRLIRLVNEAKNKFQVPITDEATQLKSSLDILKDRLRNRITELEYKLVRKDFTREPKRVIQLDAEARKLHFKAAQVKAKWHEALMRDRLARRTIPQKILGTGGEVLNTTRAVLTSLDLSAVLRQGGFISYAHPIRAAKAFPAMFRALRSEAGQHAVTQEIMARKNYPLYQQSKLYLSEHGQKLSQMEEAYMSRWADKIPLVAASQRAYTTFLNRLRADSFDAMADTLSRTGEVTPHEAKAIANFINVATGRGKLGVKDNAAVGLSTIFFAPRYVASRFQLIAGQPFYKGTTRTRTLVAKEYARFLIGAGVIYGLGTLAGGDVETDSRSSDFGKLRFDDTRLDPMAGLLQSTVLLARLGSGETTRLSGKTVAIRGEGVPFGGDDAADVTARFLRTKLSPVVGTTVNILSGTDVTGEKVTPEKIGQDLLVPLALKDILKAMEDQGVPRGTALVILSIFGMGLQTYER